MKSLQVAQTQEPGSYTDRTDQVSDKSIVIPNKLVTIADSFKGEHSWFIAPQIPTDFSIQAQETTYNVHKYPLISKCGYIRRLEVQPLISNSGNELKLENFPGGSETFETILKFCYGLPIDFSPDNIAALRCASEFLEMTEELEDGNLVSKAEAFLTFVVLTSWKDTITVLRSCENLSPWAENLQIVRRCCDSIAWKASKDEPTSEEAAAHLEGGWWFNDVASFRIDHFMRIISAIRAKGTKPGIIGKCIMHYAKRWLPGMDVELEGLRGYGHEKCNLQFSIFSRKKTESSGHSKEQKTIVENLVSVIPPHQDAVPCKFLLQMLKMAMMYSVSPALTSELEKRVSMVLEDAEVNDLLIPRYQNGDQEKIVNTNSSEECTMQDTDVVQRIVEYFLMHEQQQMQQQQKSRKFNISRLLDSYLAEIARDPNLSVTKFQVLAELLPANTRPYDDGLYRAIDTYLKTHPSLAEHDRRRLCKIMNCEKLSLDACMHAAQNERLPMRTVVQVLFSEQVKMRTAMQEKEPAQSVIQSEQEDGNQTSATMDIKTLKTELENVKSKMAELQSDYFELQQEYEKLSNKPKNLSGWSLNWRKIKNSFHTKPTALETGEEQDIPKTLNPTRHKGTPRRRLSMS